MRSADQRRVQRITTTTTFRLAFFFGLLSAIGIIAFGGLIYGMTAHSLIARSDEILRQEAQRLSAASPPALPREIRDEVARNIHGLNYFALVSPSGELVEGNIAPIPGLQPDCPIDIEAGDGHGPMRVMAVTAGTGETILLGRDIGEHRLILRHMVAIMLIGSVAVIMMVLVAGGVLSLGPLRRVRELRIASEKIAAGQFDVRVPLVGRNDEFDQIASMINAMVDDIERVIAQVKSVTDGIAHDLRTPLTRLRNRLDDARLAGAVLPSGDSVDDLIGDLDIVLERFAALLRIAELEASERRAGFGEIDVGALLGVIAELYAPLAEDAGIALRLRCDPAIRLQCDANLLMEAIGNLVDNAIKFARSEVSIAAYEEGGTRIIAVGDDGPGIAASERGAVLQRFYRVSGDGGAPGHGLGLSIVAAILHLHHFDLALLDASPGLVAQIRSQP